MRGSALSAHHLDLEPTVSHMGVATLTLRWRYVAFDVSASLFGYPMNLDELKFHQVFCAFGLSREILGPCVSRRCVWNDCPFVIHGTFLIYGIKFVAVCQLLYASDVGVRLSLYRFLGLCSLVVASPT